MKKETKIKIGVVGVGHLGNFHLKQLKRIPKISISGLYDIDSNRADEMSKLYDVKRYSSMDELLKDAIADAKAVRETALANAKLALEEAFTPRLKSMLSKKIQAEM